MLVLMMDIGKMRMMMTQKPMRVRVRVRLAAIPIEFVLVPMMIVVLMGVRMRHRLVDVLVHVVFGNVQPDTDSHTHRSAPKSTLGGLAIEKQRDRGANERSRRKVGARTRTAQVAQSDDEQDEAQAIPQKPQRHGDRDM